MAARSANPVTVNDALVVVERAFKDVEGWSEAVSRAAVAGDIAEELYALRARHALTQKELAMRAGTSQSAIARMENAEYRGHSIAMLRRIAESVGERVSVAFVAVPETAARSSRRMPAPLKTRAQSKRVHTSTK
jgi:DNA-binding XRE family transcriptional regulator